MCTQRRLRTAWASAQSGLESSLSAWRKLGSLATHWAHSEDWSDWVDAQADLSLCWAHSHFVGIRPVWSESSLGAQSFCWFCCEAAHLYSDETTILGSVWSEYCVCRFIFSGIPYRNFCMTDQCKEMSSYTRGCKTTLVYDLKTSFWWYNVSFDVFFRKKFQKSAL